jgi:hypothetical protein
MYDSIITLFCTSFMTFTQLYSPCILVLISSSQFRSSLMASTSESPPTHEKRSWDNSQVAPWCFPRLFTLLTKHMTAWIFTTVSGIEFPAIVPDESSVIDVLPIRLLCERFQSKILLPSLTSNKGSFRFGYNSLCVIACRLWNPWRPSGEIFFWLKGILRC